MNLKILFSAFILFSMSIAHASHELALQQENQKVKIYFSNVMSAEMNFEKEGLTLRIFDLKKSQDAVLVLNAAQPDGEIDVTDKSTLIVSLSYKNPSNNNILQCIKRFSLDKQTQSYDMFFKVTPPPAVEGKRLQPVMVAKCQIIVKPHVNLIEPNLLEMPQRKKQTIEKKGATILKQREIKKEDEEEYEIFMDLKRELKQIQRYEENLDEEKFKEFFRGTKENPKTSLVKEPAVWAQLTEYQTIKLLNNLRENPGMEYESFKKLLQQERSIASVIIRNPTFLVSPEILQTQENWQIQMLQRKIEEINYKLFTTGYITYPDEQDIKDKIIFKDPPVFTVVEQKVTELLNEGKEIAEVVKDLNWIVKFPQVSFLSAQRKMSYFKRFLSDFDGSIIALGRQTREEFHNSKEVYTVDIAAPTDLVANAFDLGTARYFLQNSIDMNRKFKFVLFERIGLGWLSKKTVGTPHNSAQSVHEVLKTYADCLENNGYIIILGGGAEYPSKEEFINITAALDALKEDKEAQIEGYDIIPTNDLLALTKMKENSNSLDGNWDKVFPPKSEIKWSSYIIFIKKSTN